MKADCKVPEGFACPKTAPRTTKSDKQLLFLEDLEGDESQKVSPIQAYEFMRNATNEDGSKITQVKS